MHFMFVKIGTIWPNEQVLWDGQSLDHCLAVWEEKEPILLTISTSENENDNS